MTLTRIGEVRKYQQGLLAGKEGPKKIRIAKETIPPTEEKEKENHLSPKASKPCKIERR